MTPDKPIILAFNVEAANFTGVQMALEQLAKRSQLGYTPFAVGEVIVGEFWKVTVTEKRNLLIEQEEELRQYKSLLRGDGGFARQPRT